MAKERLKDIDKSKGIAIFLVVLGHNKSVVLQMMQNGMSGLESEYTNFTCSFLCI